MCYQLSSCDVLQSLKLKFKRKFRKMSQLSNVASAARGLKRKRSYTATAKAIALEISFNAFFPKSLSTVFKNWYTNHYLARHAKKFYKLTNNTDFTNYGAIFGVAAIYRVGLCSNGKVFMLTYRDSLLIYDFASDSDLPAQPNEHSLHCYLSDHLKPDEICMYKIVRSGFVGTTILNVVYGSRCEIRDMDDLSKDYPNIYEWRICEKYLFKKQTLSIPFVYDAVSKYLVSPMDKFAFRIAVFSSFDDTILENFSYVLIKMLNSNDFDELILKYYRSLFRSLDSSFSYVFAVRAYTPLHAVFDDSFSTHVNWNNKAKILIDVPACSYKDYCYYNSLYVKPDYCNVSMYATVSNWLTSVLDNQFNILFYNGKFRILFPFHLPVTMLAISKCVTIDWWPRSCEWKETSHNHLPSESAWCRGVQTFSYEKLAACLSADQIKELYREFLLFYTLSKFIKSDVVNRHGFKWLRFVEFVVTPPVVQRSVIYYLFTISVSTANPFTRDSLSNVFTLTREFVGLHRDSRVDVEIYNNNLLHILQRFLLYDLGGRDTTAYKFYTMFNC